MYYNLCAVALAWLTEARIYVCGPMHQTDMPKRHETEKNLVEIFPLYYDSHVKPTWFVLSETSFWAS